MEEAYEYGWFSKSHISKLRIIMRELYGSEHSDTELQEIGLNIARFVLVKEVATRLPEESLHNS